MRTCRKVRIFFANLFLLYMTLSSFLKSEKVHAPHYVLFGNPVEHSLSPLMHNTALQHYGMEARYYAIEIQSAELSRLASYLNRETFQGANITIPYKQVIGDYLDTIDPEARSVGAVNTIVKKGFQLQGFNTDVFGFLAPLQDHADRLEGGRAVIFGTGGAARAIVTALSSLGMQELYLVSRRPGRIDSFNREENVTLISYNQWTSYADEAVLIVNTTPLGMDPRIDTSPVKDAEQEFLAGRICYDVVYNPLKTKFLALAEKAGATTIGGLEMLIQQGSRSFELWTGRPFPIDNIRKLLHEHFQQ
ncbi:shikimate dehydrogenase [Fodinibius sediminis]|uniref:Shikimate dehydrogenase (NADP(+)) n=1 Tax=Fodinibius sediminis TaxID=1214077 RepID=A0A521B2E1_9BACT|nr:shikimate dehydrogenase [Fodinibius sediminis]SMO41209.1 shikimate dehydrogenase [Fodinibius sediminis]